MIYRQGCKGLMLTGGPYKQGTPTNEGPYTHCPISTNKRPLHDIQARPHVTPQTRSPYRTRDSYRRCIIPTGKGLLETPTWYTGKGPLLVKGSIQAREHNISITALLDFKKIILFFNISLFFKTLEYRFKSEILLHIFSLKSYKIFTSVRMENFASDNRFRFIQIVNFTSDHTKILVCITCVTYKPLMFGGNLLDYLYIYINCRSL